MMSSDQFSVMQARFDAIDERFAGVDQRFEEIDKQLLKMSAYMNKRFDAIERKLERKADKSTVVAMQNSLDGFLGMCDRLDTEQGAIVSRIMRVEERIAWLEAA